MLTTVFKAFKAGEEFSFEKKNGICNKVFPNSFYFISLTCSSL